MMNVGSELKKLGFTNLKCCVGKTIEVIEDHPMVFGCTFYHCWLIRFTDGTRAWEANQVGSGIYPGPRLESLSSSQIVTPEEYGAMIVAEKKERDFRIKQDREMKKRQLTNLKKELGVE